MIRLIRFNIQRPMLSSTPTQVLYSPDHFPIPGTCSILAIACYSKIRSSTELWLTEMMTDITEIHRLGITEPTYLLGANGTQFAIAFLVKVWSTGVKLRLTSK